MPFVTSSRRFIALLAALLVIGSACTQDPDEQDALGTTTGRDVTGATEDPGATGSDAPHETEIATGDLAELACSLPHD
jgi:hypothetical protein